jgi:hypothetical protein
MEGRNGVPQGLLLLLFLEYRDELLSFHRLPRDLENDAGQVVDSHQRKDGADGRLPFQEGNLGGFPDCL